MGKPAHPRVLSESQARAVGRNIRVSPRKLNLVAESIRGKSAENALATLTFTRKRIAQDMKKILQSAIANAENNHDLDVDDLIVSEAFVGKNLTMKRFRARARGRAARIEKPFSQITIVVEEKGALESAKKKEKAAKEPAKPAPKKAKASKDQGSEVKKSTAAGKKTEDKAKAEKPAAKKTPKKRATSERAAKKDSPAKKKAVKKASSEKAAAKKTDAKAKSAPKAKAKKSQSGTKKSAKGKETK